MVGQDLKNGLLPAIENYRTTRLFDARPVSEDRVEAVLEAGRRAPSAKNRQPWRFVLISDEGIKKRLEDAAYGQEHIGSASFIVAIGTTNVDYRMPNGQLSYPVDLSFAASFMVMQASADNIGSCVVTTYDELEVKEILTVPYSMRIVMMIAFGYPAEELPPKTVTNRKALSGIMSRNHW
ncbi:MAG: nitroreductase family protein [Spirochaetales bacterium]|uniref:Nitroreductase family protein n=1 Tax=Candidatus Thalassospirochaeta sargassi TaxID=3119039 RepID=A0AAJ1MPH5_9SPIO|nr:nitroreductase family protein [Spirochaetales bacterium]